MIVSETGPAFEPIPEGSYTATCIRVIDMGTQTGAYGPKRKVLVTWEVPEHEVEDAYGDKKPGLISQTYTASLSDKANLRRDLESWRGKKFTAEELKGFDLASVLGAGCLLGVVHNDSDGKTYANISSILALPKGMPRAAPVHDLVNFDLDSFNREAFDALSDKMREKISATPEYLAATGQTAKHDTSPGFAHDDEIPF